MSQFTTGGRGGLARARRKEEVSEERAAQSTSISDPAYDGSTTNDAYKAAAEEQSVPIALQDNDNRDDSDASDQTTYMPTSAPDPSPSVTDGQSDDDAGIIDNTKGKATDYWDDLKDQGGDLIHGAAETEAETRDDRYAFYDKWIAGGFLPGGSDPAVSRDDVSAGSAGEAWEAMWNVLPGGNSDPGTPAGDGDGTRQLSSVLPYAVAAIVAGIAILITFAGDS